VHDGAHRGSVDGLSISHVNWALTDARRPAGNQGGRGKDRHMCLGIPGKVVTRTPFGATRVVERELGEQLPRIC